MKIGHPVELETFKPFTITVETAEEAAYLRGLLSNTNGGMEAPFNAGGNVGYQIWEATDKALGDIGYKAYSELPVAKVTWP